MLECSAVRLYVVYWTISTAEAGQGFEAAPSAALLSLHIFQYIFIWLGPRVESVYWIFYWNFYDILTHAQTVSTRHFLLHEGP